jgi:hypothetical protein
MYMNGNNYEEFCNIVDIEPDDCRDTFEKVVLYMDTVDSLE